MVLKLKGKKISHHYILLSLYLRIHSEVLSDYPEACAVRDAIIVKVLTPEPGLPALHCPILSAFSRQFFES